MKVVEYWHGAIKNYRYGGDISYAIINSGPWEAGANPIQISGGGGWTPQPCLEHGESLGGRSCRRSSPESHRAQERCWTPKGSCYWSGRERSAHQPRAPLRSSTLGGGPRRRKPRRRAWRRRRTRSGLRGRPSHDRPVRPRPSCES